MHLDGITEVAHQELVLVLWGQGQYLANPPFRMCGPKGGRRQINGEPTNVNSSKEEEE